MQISRRKDILSPSCHCLFLESDQILGEIKNFSIFTKSFFEKQGILK